MPSTDLQAADAALRSVATFAENAANNLAPLSPADAFREPLADALSGQPPTLEMLLDGVAAKDWAAHFAAFLASPAGALVEPGTAQNLIARAGEIDAARASFSGLAAALRDAVAQVGG